MGERCFAKIMIKEANFLDISLKRELLQIWKHKNLLVYDSENEASIVKTKKVENFSHQFLDHFKSILVK